MAVQMWVFDGASLVELVLRSTLVLLGTLAVLALLRKGNARPRSVLIACAFLVLMGVLGLSLVGAEGPWSGLRVELPVGLWMEEAPEAPSATFQDFDQSSALTLARKPTPGLEAVLGIDSELVSPKPSSPSAKPRASLGWRLVPLAFFGIWLLGMIALLLRVAVGLVHMQRITSRSEPASRVIVDAFEEVVPLNCTSSLPNLFVSDEVAVPMTWGSALGPWFRPVVLLPRRAEGWSKQRLQVVLLHELGHVTLGDWAARLMTRMVRCAYWWQPLAHWACQRLELEQELACDEWVVRRVKPSEYAQHLLSLHRELRGQRSQALVMALPMLSKRQLERRVMNLLDPSVLRRSTGRPVLMVALCFMFLVAAVQPEVVRRTVLPVEMVPEVAAPSVWPEAPPIPTPAPSVSPEGSRNFSPRWLEPSATRLPAPVLAPQPPIASMRSWVRPLAASPTAPVAVPSARRFPQAFAVAPVAPRTFLAPSALRSARAPVVVSGAFPVRGVLAGEEELTEEEKEALARVRQRLAELEVRREALAQEAEEEREQLLARARELRLEAEQNQIKVERQLASQYEDAFRRHEELEALAESERIQYELSRAQEEVSRQGKKMRVKQERALSKARQALVAAERKHMLERDGLQEQRLAELKALEKETLERRGRLERNQQREGRSRRLRELERDRSKASEERLREVEERLREREERRDNVRRTALADLERLREELQPRSKELAELERRLAQERLLTFRSRAPLRLEESMRAAPVAPRAPVIPRPRSPRVAPRGLGPELRERIEAVIREEAVALGLEDSDVSAATQSVVGVLGTHHKLRTENGDVLEDQVYVVGSPAEVRNRLTGAWQEELDLSVGTEKQERLRAAIGRLAYEILEVQQDG